MRILCNEIIFQKTDEELSLKIVKRKLKVCLLSLDIFFFAENFDRIHATFATARLLACRTQALLDQFSNPFSKPQPFDALEKSLQYRQG